MPKILQLKVENDQVWARIDMPTGGKSVSIWTESELKQRLEAERERCIQALLNLKPD